jgi:GDPmannose 4,6-dehydratase
VARTALVIGISGQDGAYLARLLIGKGYVVHGASRDAEITSFQGLSKLGIRDQVKLNSVSPTDFRSVIQVIDQLRPDEIYNLSGQSSVAMSFEQPAETLQSIVNGTLNILEAIRTIGTPIRLYNSGSSESFGDTGGHPANELTAFRPRSPYGTAKAAAVWLVANYRDAYGLFACSGLLFNHESPLRPERFVTRKITAAAVRISQVGGERLKLGDLSIRRDWGWAPDYVEAMWSMLQRDNPSDFVIATGISHTLEEFTAAAFQEVGLDWRDHVDHDPTLIRPSDISVSLGDASKAATMLGWKPKVSFAEMIARMVHAGQDKGENCL